MFSSRAACVWSCSQAAGFVKGLLRVRYYSGLKGFLVSTQASAVVPRSAKSLENKELEQQRRVLTNRGHCRSPDIQTQLSTRAISHSVLN